METYILVSFWIGAVSIFLRCVLLSVGKYPREITFGMDVGGVLVSLPFLIWAGILLWG